MSEQGCMFVSRKMVVKILMARRLWRRRSRYTRCQRWTRGNLERRRGLSGNWRPVLRGYLEKGAEVEVETEEGAEAGKENVEEVEAEVDTEVEAEVAIGEVGAETGEEVDLGPEEGGAGAGIGGRKIVVSTDKVRILS